MSGEGIRRSIWIILLPVMFLFGLVMLILLSQVDLSGIGVPSEATSGLGSGIAQILPELGAGLVIGIIFLVFAVVSRRRR